MSSLFFEKMSKSVVEKLSVTVATGKFYLEFVAKEAGVNYINSRISK